jgi:hypothetical protein
MLLLRVGRRKTAWELKSVDTIIKTEFSTLGEVELNTSVYLIDVSDVTRTVAEHAAGSGLDPPRGFDNVDLECGRVAHDSPGTTGFRFTTEAHRELKFADENDLRSFLETEILPQMETRRYVASKADIREYAKKRQAEGDSEWVRFLETTSKSWP